MMEFREGDNDRYEKIDCSCPLPCYDALPVCLRQWRQARRQRRPRHSYTSTFVFMNADVYNSLSDNQKAAVGSHVDLH